MTFVERNKRLRFSEEDRKSRVEDLQAKTGFRFPTYSVSQIDSRSVSGNIENFIGTVQVPTGLVGPLNFHFKDQKSEEVFAPLSTTEGALISSVQRGSIVLNLSKGVTTRVLNSQMIRAPQFEFASLDGAIEFKEWILLQVESLQHQVQRKSNHARLLRIEPRLNGRSVHCRFVYTTGNAAGQNMTTFCTAYLCQFLMDRWAHESSHPIVDFVIEGNLSSDKKASFISTLEGRGRTVVAEAVLRGSAVKRILKLNPEDLVRRYQKTKSAHFLTGFFGYNINVANVVAGLFLATGQDMACVHESSIGEFHMELQGNDVYVSLHMPSLVVGTVGGGTHLPSFRDNLSILKCLDVPDGADRLAQIIAGYALALEISTVCAIGAGQFVNAHQKYGREASVNTLKASDFDTDFFKKSFSDEHVLKVQKIESENKQGFITDIAQQVSRKMSGLLAFEVETQHVKKRAFLKVKAPDREIVQGCAKILGTLSPNLAEILIQKKEFLPFESSHLREIEVLSKKHPAIMALSPEYYGSFIDDGKEAYILIQELLSSDMTISEVNDVSYFTAELKSQVIQKIASLHAEFLNQKEKAFTLSENLLEFSSLKDLEEQAELWDAMFIPSYGKLQSSYKNLFQVYDQTLHHYSSLIEQMQNLDHSLIHYDFNPRNMAFGSEVYFFDWEFAAWGLPQRDIIEFALFVARPENIATELQSFSQKAFEVLYPSQPEKKNEWDLGMQLCLKEFILRRLPFYFVLSEMSFCPYLDQILANLDILCQEQA